jgi:enamine deaminase RidA (YjgF/YER057c/UK114 family)
MNHHEARLREMAVTLPTLPQPIANYVPAKQSGNLVFTAGQVSSANGVEYKGKLGDGFAMADAQAATRACVINCLAAIKAQIGSLDRI